MANTLSNAVAYWVSAAAAVLQWKPERPTEASSNTGPPNDPCSEEIYHQDSRTRHSHNKPSGIANIPSSSSSVAPSSCTTAISAPGNHVNKSEWIPSSHHGCDSCRRTSMLQSEPRERDGGLQKPDSVKPAHDTAKNIAEKEEAKPQNKGILQIDTTMAAPGSDVLRRQRPASLDLSSTHNQPTIPSAAATACVIGNHDSVSHPESITSPRISTQSSRMSKSSTATVSKPSSQLPSKSAWAKGPPQSTASAPSPRSASPAPNQGHPQQTHSRRPSALGQGVSFRDGVAGARSPTTTAKPVSAVTFGSINDASAPISASPAPVSTIKSATVSSFGSVPATPNSAPNGKSAGSSAQAPTSATTQPKFDVKRLFQKPSSTPAMSGSPLQGPSDVAFPSTRPSPLPQASPLPTQSQPSQMGAPLPYSLFNVPSSGLTPPHSPVFLRQMPDGQMENINGRLNDVSVPTSMSANISSPRLGPLHSEQSPTDGPPTPQVPAPGWYGGGYYYQPHPGMPPEHYMPYSPWMQPHVVGTLHQQPQDQPGQLQPGIIEPVAPLSNRWQPQSSSKKGQASTDSLEVVDRKVRALLNKLTMERFDPISDQIIMWANKSEKEQDGQTLIQVIRLVFEKATDEAAWSEMYARLCRKMMEQISPKVQDEGIKNAEGKPIAGGQLFRKYLLNRCHEHGWAAKENTAAAAATKATEDEAAKAAAEKDEDGEAALYSEEYYAAQKAKRQGLGLIKFIGELFKLQMLTERIMHECVKKLLGNVENPEEEEIESLCKLLTTVGQLLDTPKARAHMDVYFTRMKELVKNPKVNSRMQFMLLDLIELRDRKWVVRNQAAGPTTISAVHAQAAKETAAKEKDYQRTLSMSRGGSRRDGERGDHQVGPDGWAVAGNAPSRAPPKAGDLSQFGKISKTNSMTFGPTGVFANAKDKSKRESASLSRGSNMFSKLMENSELATEVATATSSRPPSRKPSVDLGSAGAPEAPPQRRKLNLLPRTLPKPDESKTDSTPAQSDAGHSDDEESIAPSMSETEAKTRIGEDSKEFFSIRDLGEAEVYFSKLPSEHRWLLVDKLVTSAIESKEADAQLVGDFFSRAVLRNLCSPEHFEKGFEPTAEILDDIAIDAPKAFNLMAIMMKGAQFDEERRTRLASKSTDSDKLMESIAPSMSEAEARMRIGDAKEFFNIRDLDEAEHYFHELPSRHRWLLVDRLVISAVTNSNEADAQLVSDFFSRTALKNLCAPEQFEKGFLPTAEVLDAIDVPKAFNLMATMMKGAQLDGERWARVARRSMGSQADRLFGLLPASAKSTSEDVVPTSSIPPSRGFNEPDEPLMFEEQVKLQLRIEVEQFFKVRDLDMGETGLRGLPSAHRWRLVSNLVLFATLSGTKDARLVGNLLSRAAEKGLCSPEAFELAFSPVMDGLDVFTSHNPTAFILIAIMLKATQLDRERLSRLVRRAVETDADMLLGLLL
ncbi:hypothetical protein DAEQUDRAFT_809168 [Daedalea quercina L-15889]|uniref:MI domain-containing protein n=1 Tax=Daedalea quercina L-15889 TaxID=1314783 RepID=A0A165SNT3_9APHY|nr:hypothetical protein DAEQUDRAFT_809168 [Daedalea quercina L-15889]